METNYVAVNNHKLQFKKKTLVFFLQKKHDLKKLFFSHH